MTCPFKPYVLRGVEATGVYQCSSCGAFTNDPPEVGNYICKRTGEAPCIEVIVKEAAQKLTVANKPCGGCWG